MCLCVCGQRVGSGRRRVFCKEEGNDPGISPSYSEVFPAVQSQWQLHRPNYCWNAGSERPRQWHQSGHPQMQMYFLKSPMLVRYHKNNFSLQISFLEVSSNKIQHCFQVPPRPRRSILGSKRPKWLKISRPEQEFPLYHPDRCSSGLCLNIHLLKNQSTLYLDRSHCYIFHFLTL